MMSMICRSRRLRLFSGFIGASVRAIFAFRRMLKN
jgi:hypothetical protein